MRYNELFNVIKTMEVDEFGFTKEVCGFKLHIYSHKQQFNIIRDGIPRIIITNYDDNEVKIYRTRDGYVDYNRPNMVSPVDDEIKDSIAFAVDLLS